MLQLKKMDKLKLILAGWSNVLIPDERVDDIGKERAKICADCPKAEWSLVATLTISKERHIQEVAGMSCSECGCPLSAKVRSPGAECPLFKWKSVNLNHLYMETSKIMAITERWAQNVCKNLQMMRNAGENDEKLITLSNGFIRECHAINERIFEMQNINHQYKEYDFSKSGRLYKDSLGIFSKESATSSFIKLMNTILVEMPSIESVNAYITDAKKLLKNDDKVRKHLFRARLICGEIIKSLSGETEEEIIEEVVAPVEASAPAMLFEELAEETLPSEEVSAEEVTEVVTEITEVDETEEITPNEEF